MSVQDAIAAYSLESGLSAESERQLHAAFNSFGRYLGRTPALQDLKDNCVSLWLRALEPELSGRTVYGYRASVLTVWRYISDKGLVPAPTAVRRVRKPPPQPDAWTMEQLRMLLIACDLEQYVMPNGVVRSQYFRAFINFTYDTALRKSDVFAVRREWIQGCDVYLRQQKTRYAHVGRIREVTRQQIDRLPGDRPLEYPLSEKSYYDAWKRIRGRAGVPGGGGAQKIRRSAASYVERDSPGSATRLLGHRSPEMAKHYVDPRIAYPAPPMPPALD